jgi:hypothetical protein
MVDYVKIYNLERYLIENVGTRFRETGAIEPVDFLMILIWKSNRAKTKIRDRLKRNPKANGSFDTAVVEIPKTLFAETNKKERLAILMRDWGLRLPMASAVLTILYPEEFTVYDRRVCGMLGLKCKDLSFSDQCWKEYEDYEATVRAKGPSDLSLRDKDRYLWGKSFWEDAKRDAQ